MKKLLILSSLLIGVSATGFLRAEDAPATVSLPAISAPAPAAEASPAPAGDATPKKSGHKGHKKHHKKKSGETAPATESVAPKS
jgi:hypothetical protein